MDLPKNNCRTEDKLTCIVTEVKSPLHQLQTVTAHCKFENFPVEHSAVPLNCIELPHGFKISVLSIFERPHKTGFNFKVFEGLLQIRCNFPNISYLSETQKNNFQFLS